MGGHRAQEALEEAAPPRRVRTRAHACCMFASIGRLLSTQPHPFTPTPTPHSYANKTLKNAVKKHNLNLGR